MKYIQESDFTQDVIPTFILFVTWRKNVEKGNQRKLWGYVVKCVFYLCNIFLSITYK